MNEKIIIKNARENNLQNISLQIPKKAITVFTGVSGSGKSSIVFDTIAEEAGRLLNQNYSSFARLYLPKYRQPNVDSIDGLCTVIAVDQKQIGGNARSTLGTTTDIAPLLRVLFSRFGIPKVGFANAFSFNDPSGMCNRCQGIGKIIALDVDKAIDKNKSLNEGAILLDGFKVGSFLLKLYTESGFFDCDKKIADYSKSEFEQLVYAQPQKVVANYKNSQYDMTYEGLSTRFIRQNINTAREKTQSNQKKITQFFAEQVCDECNGDRYNLRALQCKINGYNIADISKIQLVDLVKELYNWNIPQAKSVIDDIVNRLQLLIDIGLPYLSLDRNTSTLSGGESQRVKIAKYISSSLVDVCYIFDEPSIGLHARDVHRLNDLLIKLRDKGNTVLVVEHDPDVIKIADHIVDIGPKAGRHGGKIMFEGKFDDLLQANCLTSQYLNQKASINTKQTKPTQFFVSSKSSMHNLKDISLSIPKGMFCCITGVAGSGKSTIVNSVFAKQFDCIKIDQSGIGGNIRSNIATYTGIMENIRKLFAKSNNQKHSLFSYNSQGACKKCNGTGAIELNLSFMDISEIICDECNGGRYDKQVLEYKYKGNSIVDINNMTIEYALEFFENKDIVSVLQSLVDVGLGYMTLGQSLNTLSGGECQRLKLAKELNQNGNIYILDEPTTGLHLSDIDNILTIINKLVNSGNTVVVIEHNLEVIKRADWIIDIGPDGGTNGGQIVFEGFPVDLLKCSNSYTAKYLV